METIRGVLEAVEDKAEFATSIVARDESLALYATLPGLGPPDLCWLQKAAKSSLFSTAAEPRGFFHYCVGRDVSSSAAIAAYFADLNARVEPISMLQGLWYATDTMIQRGFYCCFDPFLRLDIRCELCIPGGVVCGALDADGTVHEVTSDMWRNCSVAAFLRHQFLDPDLTSHAPALHRWPPVSGADQERRLLDAVYDMYATGLLPKALEFVTADPARGCVAEHMDLVLYALYQYFGARHRWHMALAFFKRLQKVYHNAAVLVAAVQRELDSFDDSFATLSTALEAAPHDPALLLALANECLYADQLDMAGKLARRAVRLHRELRPAWLLLARCYIRQGLYSLAIITLNVVPPPPMPTPEQELLFGVLPPDPKYITKPSTVRYDPDLTAAKQMSNEEVATDGSRALLYLPAAVMVPHEPLDLGAWPDLGPARITRAVLSAAYGLLQELVAAIGWDSFLEMRARVFVMQSEAASKAFATRPTPKSGEPSELARQGTGLFDMTLEELAAIGLSEHPQEVEDARAANAAAVAQLKSQQGKQQDTLLTHHRDTATIPTATTNAGASPVPDDAVPTSIPPAVTDTDASTPARAAGVPVVKTPSSLPSRSSADHSVEQGDANASVARVTDRSLSPVRSRHEKLLQDADGLTAVTGLPNAVSAMQSLWGMMFGAPKSQPARGEISDSQMAKLQQFGSLVPAQHQDNVPVARSMPIAEATEERTLICQSRRKEEGWSRTHTNQGWQATPARTQPLRISSHVSTKNSCATMQQDQQRAKLDPFTALTNLLNKHCGSSATRGCETAHLTRQDAQPVCEASEQRHLDDSFSSDDDDVDVDLQEGVDSSSAARTRFPRGHKDLGTSTASFSSGSLSNLASDREFVLLGAAASSEEEHEAKAKRLCVRWLDELIIALWHDLQAYMEWKAHDTELEKKMGNTLSGLMLGLPAKSPDKQQPTGTSVDSALTELPLPRLSSVPQLPPGDWMRRGMLAERLYHDSEALLAYRCCLSGGNFSLIAGHALMRLAAEAGDLRLVLRTCLEVLSWHSRQLQPGQTAAYPPTPVLCCMGQCTSLSEASVLQEMVSQLVNENCKSPDAAKAWLRRLVAACHVAS